MGCGGRCAEAGHARQSARAAYELVWKVAKANPKHGQHQKVYASDHAEADLRHLHTSATLGALRFEELDESFQIGGV